MDSTQKQPKRQQRLSMTGFGMSSKPSNQAKSMAVHNQTMGSQNMSNLVNLLADNDLFDRAFDQGTNPQDDQPTKQRASLKKKPTTQEQPPSTGGEGMIAVLLEDSKVFRVGDRQYEFSHDDPIFTLERPVPRKELSTTSTCSCCGDPFKSAKSVVYCEFCGHPVCKPCLLKSRPLPNAGGGEEAGRGQICRQCDRKYYVRDLVKVSRQQIEDQAMEIANLFRQVEQHNQQCVEMDGDFKRFKEKSDAEIERNRAIKKKNKKVKKSLSNEAQALQEECRQQQERQALIQREIGEINDTIEQLTQTFDELNEQVLRLDLKLSQAVNARMRLEQEIQKYRKLGKQPKANNNVQPNQTQQRPQTAQVPVPVMQVPTEGKEVGSSAKSTSGSDPAASVKSRDSMGSKSIRSGQRVVSGDTDNFDTMMETPTALRYVTGSFHSDRSSGGGKRRKGKKNGGPQACCGASGSDGGNCSIF